MLAGGSHTLVVGTVVVILLDVSGGPLTCTCEPLICTAGASDISLIAVILLGTATIIS